MPTMPVAKRRKVTTTATKNASSSKSITSFTRVSKVQAVSKSIHEKTVSAATPVPTELAYELDLDKKRKAVSVDEIEVDPSADDASSNILSSAISSSQRAIKPLPQRRSNELQREPQTPRKPISTESCSTPIETPTKGARGLLDRLRLTKETSIPELSSSQLPEELLDLINLHSAFLTALTLHYAHNGTHTPADLRLLCPDVARAWGKRRVLLDDIRRTLAILYRTAEQGQATKSKSSTVLSLSDYGHGKICVEHKGGRAGKIARPLDENHLNDEFTKNLTNLWEDQKNEAQSVTAFISGLPQAPITICSSLTKMSPLLAKGQRRLEDMRAVIIERKEAASEPKAAPVPVGTVGDRKLSLLERLKAKQQHQSTLPPPPTKAELDRQAALHRVDEVVSVLTLLSTSTSVGQQRVSFTLPTVLGKLKDSFKTPMSKAEGEICVRLLAAEIAPSWLKLMKIGRNEAIVVDRDCRPSEPDLQERIRRAL